MVLGILSVMVIMAVAFAIAMRTERVAAGNFADGVRARQLAQIGLARAMNDLAGLLGTNGLRSAGGGQVYPAWVVTNSYTNDYVNTSPNLYLVHATNLPARDNQATNFVPRALWAAATNADWLSADHHWLPLDSIIYTNNAAGFPSPAESNRVGRVKYLILNCSGLLDANFAGGVGSVRGIGTNPTEIAINGMPEFSAGGTFLNNRDSGADRHYRYETLEELAALNTSVWTPSNFTVYSHALPDYWDGAAIQPQINLACTNFCDLSQTNDANVIITAFVSAGFNLSEAKILFSNLVDYVDGDVIPGNLTTCVEPVPLINEIVVSSIANASGGVENNVAVILWYPFCGHDSPNYKFRLEYSVHGKDNNSQTCTNLTIEQASMPPTNSFHAHHLLAPIGQTTNRPYTFTLNAVEVLHSDGITVLDKVISFQPAVTMLANADATRHSECIDPRFNYDMNNPNQWTVFADGSSLTNINNATTTYWLNNPDYDKDGAMFVANQPMRRAGELGYLAYDTWKTVKLYGENPPGYRVLDYFSVGTNVAAAQVTNITWRGRVNPNSLETNALGAVFNDMPLDDYSASPDKLLWQNATNVAAQIRANVQNHGAYTNLSDIGRYFTAAQFPPSADNELKKEAIFRNAISLFNLRQNLFTIIIEAQVASGGNIPSNPVRQRAVALVWRDPYTGEMFVRSIKWLKD